VWLWILTGLWILLLLAIGLSNAIGPELTLAGQINLFLPQWIYALPGVVIVPCFLFTARRLIWVPLAALGYVGAVLMGYNFSFQRDVPGAPHLKVMTFNMKWGRYGSGKVAREIADFDPDVIQLQDIGTSLRLPLAPLALALRGYHVRQNLDFIVASKYPITQIQSTDTDFPGYESHIDRVWVRFGKRGIAFYNVHLRTPRFGLVAIKKRRFDGIESDTRIRLEAARILAANLIKDKGPIIVTGDFNAPVQSLVCRTVSDLGFTDAFQAGGRGYGYSYGQDTPVKRPYVRIDHIFVNDAFHVVNATVGRSDASEHIPVRAVVALTGK
jgi:endonuclease/exonuclease/phosphatase family metal-dependent hydrolase